MKYLLLLLSFSALALDSNDIYDKSFPRDNTFCSYKGTRVELIIRGGSKFTEPSERGYGEFLFYRKRGTKAKLLELNRLRGDTFTFFAGDNTHCSKSHGHIVDDSSMAVLFLKENRPFKNKLVIQFLDLNTMEPKDVIETNYLSDQAIKSKDGFIFNSLSEHYNPEMGKVKIGDAEYIFHEDSFPQWIEYSNKSFTIDPDYTYGQFPLKTHFKDKEEFFNLAGWNRTEKKFSRPIMYTAVNYKIKKKCLLLIEQKQKLVGTEMWRCQEI